MPARCRFSMCRDMSLRCAELRSCREQEGNKTSTARWLRAACEAASPPRVHQSPARRDAKACPSLSLPSSRWTRPSCGSSRRSSIAARTSSPDGGRFLRRDRVAYRRRSQGQHLRNTDSHITRYECLAPGRSSRSGGGATESLGIVRSKIEQNKNDNQFTHLGFSRREPSTNSC
jgi:hypothetical protein